jgi:hypothetical protein
MPTAGSDEKPGAAELTERLAAAMGAGRWTQTADIIDALIRARPGPDAVRLLVGCLGNDNPADATPFNSYSGDRGLTVSEAAESALVEIGPPAVPILRSASCDAASPPAVRRAAPTLLGGVARRHPETAAEIVPALLGLLSDLDRDVALRAIRGLGRAGPSAAGAAAEMVARVSDPALAADLFDALGDIGPAAAAVSVPALTAAMDRVHPPNVYWALARLGPAASAAVPRLREEAARLDPVKHATRLGYVREALAAITGEKPGA